MILNRIFFAVNLVSILLILITTTSLYLSFIFDFGYFSLLISFFFCFFVFLISFKHLKHLLNDDNLPVKVGIFILIAGILFGVFLKTQAVDFNGQAYMVAGGGMYGDSALHAAYTSKILAGEFPPENPLFAGKILVYPYANDLLSAIFLLLNFHLSVAFYWPQVFFFITFIFLWYKFAIKLTDFRGYFISVLTFFFGWGIGFIYYFAENINQRGTLFSNLDSEFTNNPTYNLNFHNSLTGLMLPERSLLPGLVLGLLIVISFLNYFEHNKSKYLILIFAILGILPFWHTHSFIFFSLFLLTVIFYKFTVEGLNAKFVKGLILGAFTGFGLIFPFLYLFFANHEATGFLHFTLGWMNKNENLLLYWLRNSFLVLPFALIGFIIINKNYKVFFVGAFISFVLANFVIFQPWDWDNIKILTLCFLFFSILSGKFLSVLWQKSFIAPVLVVLAVITMFLSGLLSIYLQLKNKYTLYDNYDIALATWAKTSTEKESVFLIEPVPTHPIPGLAGRSVYVGYPGHLWVHGIDYSQRELEINRIFAGDISYLSILKGRVSYITVPSRLFYLFDNYAGLVFENTKYRVYKIT